MRIWMQPRNRRDATPTHQGAANNSHRRSQGLYSLARHRIANVAECQSGVEDKFGRNFRLSREMRDEILV